MAKAVDNDMDGVILTIGYGGGTLESRLSGTG